MSDTAINHAIHQISVPFDTTIYHVTILSLLQQSITLLYLYGYSNLIRSILLLPQQPNTFYTPVDTATQHVTTPLLTQQTIMLLHSY